MFDEKTAKSLEKAAEEFRFSWGSAKGRQTIFLPTEPLPVNEKSLKDITPKPILL